MNLPYRGISLTAGVLAALLAAPAVQADVTSDDQAAVFKAAGFKKERGGKYVRCKEDPPTASYSLAGSKRPI